MQYHKKILSLALAAALLTLAGCGSRQEDPAGSQDQSNAQPAGVAVQVQTVTSETISAENTVSGSRSSRPMKKLTHMSRGNSVRIKK